MFDRGALSQWEFEGNLKLANCFFILLWFMIFWWNRKQFFPNFMNHNNGSFKTDIALIQEAFLHEPSKFLKDMLNLQTHFLFWPNLSNRCRPKHVKRHQITNIFGLPRYIQLCFFITTKNKGRKKEYLNINSPWIRFPIFPHCALRTWCGLLDG